ncbi:hypothetical protein BH20ACT7_BH20ACT7_20380 [soil metagenome]|jgi:hypothetical protein
METDHPDTDLGLSRRDLLRRGAIVGGTLVWAAPAVQTLARPAFAQEYGGSPACEPCLETSSGGQCVQTRYMSESPDCCDCLDEQQANGADAFTAAFNCQQAGRCNFDSPSRPMDCTGCPG